MRHTDLTNHAEEMDTTSLGHLGEQEDFGADNRDSCSPEKAHEGVAPCRHCGHEGFCTRRETLRLRVAGYAFRASQTVLHCVSCGSTQWSPQLLKRFRLQIAAWLAHEGVQSGAAFKFMRKALGLKAVELSRLLSLAPETLSRWERGHRQCDNKAITILGTMVMDRLSGHDHTMQRLQALKTPPPEPTPVDLTRQLSSLRLAG